MDDTEFLRAFLDGWPAGERFGHREHRTAGGATVDEAIAMVPMLLDKNLAQRHWRRTALFGPEARAVWVEPDLRPLPF